MTQSELDGTKQAINGPAGLRYPYSPSIASTSSSSFASIFSADGQSSQSSAPGSAKSSSPSWDGDSRTAGTNHATNGTTTTATATTTTTQDHLLRKVSSAPETVTITQDLNCRRTSVSDHAVAPELRVHPRRTQCPNVAESDSATASACQARQPPPLVRQYDRKDNFVESLVDTTTQMIEVIWPLSVVPCGRDAVLGGKNLIGLRTFIQEVLKRSKTSYSTLQVALYYLVLIKPCIPKADFTKEQLEDSHASRAMQCGRRMFLAALILASKYLQDRNYSARAWSKISGLKVAEINSNEMAFVTAVDWNLHIPEPRFQRWTDVVLKFSLSPASSPLQSCTRPTNSWRSIIPRLTPELDDLEISGISSMTLMPKPGRTLPTVLHSMSPPPTIPRSSPDRLSPTSRTPTPNACAKPEALEPTPRANRESFRFPPISPKITQLPTPQMTPRSNIFCTPAVSASNVCPARRCSMTGAMRHAQSLSMLRCAIDSWPSSSAVNPDLLQHRPARPPQPIRRSSLAQTTGSLMSSPESMISDLSSTQSSNSSRSSRSSSISSVASTAGALLSSSTRLAMQATRRCATMQQMTCVKENEMPVVVRSVSPPDGLWENPNPFACGPPESYVRGTKEPSEATAAIALQDLALSSRMPSSSPLSQMQCNSGSGSGTQRKRERPLSGIIEPKLAESFQAMLKEAARSESPAVLASARDEAALEVRNDPNLASSFLRQDIYNRMPAVTAAAASHIRSGSDGSSKNGARKRMCCKEQASSGLSLSASCRPNNNFVAPPAMGPGMWADVL